LNRARLWQDIRESAEHGAGVLVTTHNMEEAEPVRSACRDVGGRVAAEGTVAEVIGSRTVVQVTATTGRRAFAVLDAEALWCRRRATCSGSPVHHSKSRLCWPGTTYEGRWQPCRPTSRKRL